METSRQEEEGAQTYSVEEGAKESRSQLGGEQAESWRRPSPGPESGRKRARRAQSGRRGRGQGLRADRARGNSGRRKKFLGVSDKFVSFTAGKARGSRGGSSERGLEARERLRKEKLHELGTERMPEQSQMLPGGCAGTQAMQSRVQVWGVISPLRPQSGPLPGEFPATRSSPRPGY